MFNRQVVNVYTGKRRGCGCMTVIVWIVVILVILLILSHI
jgi:hypothetical protein